MGWVSWQRARQRAAAARHVSAALEEGEETEIALSGFLGTFSGSYRSSGSPALYVNPAGALDAYEVVLTNRHLLATRVGFPSRGARVPSMTCERTSARAALVKRRLLYDRLQLGFRDGSLTLTVHRMFRRDVDDLVAALGSG